MSERSEPRGVELLEPRDALWSYLNALLAEATEPDPTPTAADAASDGGSGGGRAAVTRVLAQQRTSAPERGGRHRAAPSAGAAATLDPGDHAGLAPAWAQPDFQALLFQVGRLNLAVPLLKLHSVVPWKQRIGTLPDQPEWCHGMFRHRGCNVMVIDTERLVLPRDRRHDDAAPSAPGHILIVGDGRWGLACRTVGEVIRVTPAEVKWRSREGRRPWLAGTVLGRLCALMDTGAFSAMLEASRGQDELR